ncbi:pantoate--beta-alanine ligase [Nonlabens marinus]|nr:pantoate--beta-alanine ligase [Nonlabens marinus]
MVFESHKNLSQYLNNHRDTNKSIGFVPTMGALHQGHLALMKKALEDNDFLVVSIFVNPTQFNNPEDLKKYPRLLEADLKLMESQLDSSNFITYAPAVEDVYGKIAVSKSYHFDGLEDVMEGSQRPGHFDGVGTILQFLFEVVQPDRAYFGEKDFQQLQIIKKLKEKLQLPIEIIGYPIHREESGLAMSSRNARLSPEGFIKAAQIYQVLKEAPGYFSKHSIKETIAFVSKKISQLSGFELEYFTIADEKTLSPATIKDSSKNYRAFIVVHLEGVRLIDNIPLN